MRKYLIEGEDYSIEDATYLKAPAGITYTEKEIKEKYCAHHPHLKVNGKGVDCQSIDPNLPHEDLKIIFKDGKALPNHSLTPTCFKECFNDNLHLVYYYIPGNIIIKFITKKAIFKLIRGTQCRSKIKYEFKNPKEFVFKKKNTQQNKDKLVEQILKIEYNAFVNKGTKKPTSIDYMFMINNDNMDYQNELKTVRNTESQVHVSIEFTLPEYIRMKKNRSIYYLLIANLIMKTDDSGKMTNDIERVQYEIITASDYLDEVIEKLGKAKKVLRFDMNLGIEKIYNKFRFYPSNSKYSDLESAKWEAIFYSIKAMETHKNHVENTYNYINSLVEKEKPKPVSGFY